MDRYYYRQIEENRRDRFETARRKRAFLRNRIWKNLCYGYVLDRVTIMMLFTKEQQNLPLLSKGNVNIIISYLLNDWKLEKNDLMYKYEKIHRLKNT